MTYDLYIAAFAGAGVTLLALVSVTAPQAPGQFGCASTVGHNHCVTAHVTQ